MELVARALDGTPTADEFGRPWVGSVAEMPDEFAADSAAQIQAAFRGLVSLAAARKTAMASNDNGLFLARELDKVEAKAEADMEKMKAEVKAEMKAEMKPTTRRSI